MRARLESIWRSRKWVEALALVAGAVVVVVAVRTLGDSGSSRGRTLSREARPVHRSSLAFGHSPTGAAQAATSYLSLLAETAAGDSADASGRLSAMTTGSLRNELRQGLPALARALQARLASTAAPAAFDGWPLGYRVTSYSTPRATVEVWHLDLAASSALGLMTTNYVTTTCEVRWLAGTWRVERARSVAGPTPPPPNASGTVVDHFANALREFSGYRNAP